MEETQEQNATLEPKEDFDNPNEATEETGQVDETPELILGKFKTVNELSKAYAKLERHQGLQSQELGELRQNANLIKQIQSAWDRRNQLFNAQEKLKSVSEKYNSPEYFQDPSFRNLYKEAYLALGKNLDTDRFVNLIESYVESRIYNLEKSKSAQNETEKAINSMTFSKNNTTSITPPKKRLDEMTPKEVDDLLERLI